MACQDDGKTAESASKINLLHLVAVHPIPGIMLISSVLDFVLIFRESYM